MKILIINGPNMNMLGIREPEIYGSKTYSELVEYIRGYAEQRGVEADFFQSNSEGAIIDAVQLAYGKYDAIVINPAAYTHTSIAIADALAAVGLPAVEVHLSDINSREAFRRVSYTSAACIKVISGEGFEGYARAIDLLSER
ncbi:MAG: type II 3-dehydroquinate dehydratase [Clostridiales bacterium]|nr:type II 3-dehydroquinate dehydratase [Clostridiales bacterium]